MVTQYPELREVQETAADLGKFTPQRSLRWATNFQPAGGLLTLLPRVHKSAGFALWLVVPSGEEKQQRKQEGGYAKPR